MRRFTCARAKARAVCGWRSTTTRPRKLKSPPSWAAPRTSRTWSRARSTQTLTPMSKRTEKRMSDSYLKNVIEAALLAAARPVSVSELAQMFDEQSRPTSKEIRAQLEQLTADYEGRGVAIRENANGSAFQG